MPVKFWQTIVRFRFILNYLITTVKLFKNTYIHHRIRIFCLYWRTRGCLWVGKSFLDTLFCTPVTSKWFLKIASHDQRSLRGRGNSIRVENLHIQTAATDRNIGRGCHLENKKEKDYIFLPKNREIDVWANSS